MTDLEVGFERVHVFCSFSDCDRRFGFHTRLLETPAVGAAAARHVYTKVKQSIVCSSCRQISTFWLKPVAGVEIVALACGVALTLPLGANFCWSVPDQTLL